MFNLLLCRKKIIHNKVFNWGENKTFWTQVADFGPWRKTFGRPRSGLFENNVSIVAQLNSVYIFQASFSMSECPAVKMDTVSIATDPTSSKQFCQG